MKKRSLGKMLLLTIVTLTIYQIFWLYYTKKELVSTGGQVPSFKWLLAPYAVFLLVLIFGLISLGLSSSGSDADLNGLLWFLLIIPVSLTIVVLYAIALWWFYKYCKAAELVTKGGIGFGVSYTLVIVFSVINLSFIWPFIMQNSFNKVGEAVAPPSDATPPVPLGAR